MAETVDSARDEVNKALLNGDAPDEPIEALNAQPLGGSLHTDNNSGGTQPDPTVVVSPTIDPNAPPPVPPPIPFQFGDTTPPSNPPQ